MFQYENIQLREKIHSQSVVPLAADVIVPLLSACVEANDMSVTDDCLLNQAMILFR